MANEICALTDFSFCSPPLPATLVFGNTKTIVFPSMLHFFFGFEG